MPAPQFRNRITPAVCRRHLGRLVGIVVALAISAHVALGTPTDPAAPQPCEGLRDRITTAATPSERQSATISLAECLISRAAAAGMMAELRGDHSHRAELRRILDEAAELIDADIDKGAGDKAEATDRDKALSRRLEMLRAFGQVFRAIAADDESDASKEALMSACVELAIYADDPDDRVVAAAKLWQAAAYRRAGRADRTLQMMRPALGAGIGSAAEFYGRLERCHALADAGQFVAAIALVTKIEGKIDDWMIESSQETRRQARHTARITRAVLYRRWSASLKDSDLDERAAEALRRANEIELLANEDAQGDLPLDSTIDALPRLQADESAVTTSP
ncbi:MAG: hypothetical protein H6818_13725 [Phycisphaerales bacterium]|nr:hypothetical protein [Phycisphaerales bacterium]MCB9862139.1 hypothetical protein [Phycisphaerales bacterium]